MRVFLLLSMILFAGCAAQVGVDPVAACRAQDIVPGTEEYRVCLDAGGAEIATGPGSPYALADEKVEPIF